MKINGREINQKIFAYDGCHKIYLLDNNKQKKQALSLGYDILPIELIEEVYTKSCDLRFIYTWGDRDDSSIPMQTIVRQCERARFEF